MILSVSVFRHHLVASVALGRNALIFLAVAIMGSQDLTAQDTWSGPLVAKLEAASLQLRDMGFFPLGAFTTATSTVGSPALINVNLTAGQQYAWGAFCDDDCTDVDLILTDASGTIVDEDVETDSNPVVTYTPQNSGQFQIEIRMVACSTSICYFGLGTWVEGQAAASDLGTTTTEGELAPGDDQLTAGEFYDEIFIEVGEGQHLVADLRSKAFDPYVVAVSPSGTWNENDDFEGASDRARVDLDVSESGQWRIIVTTYAAKESGSYTLDLAVTGQRVASASDGPRLERGDLEKSDETISTGEYADMFVHQGAAGTQFVADLRSDEFDPYLLIIGPDDEKYENDDFEGSAERSVVSFTLPKTGSYRIGVTSYRPGEVGSYTLQLHAGNNVAISAGPRQEQGTLASGDATLSSGEFADSYEIDGLAGQQLSVALSSTAFDTYLMVIGPGEDRAENDDAGSTDRSEVDMTLQESGTYRVVVTSYAKGQTGAYDLVINQDASAAPSPQRDLSQITIGGDASGRLEDGDGTRENGTLRDLLVLDGQPGRQLSVSLNSSEFDTYLTVIAPDGSEVSNDDWQGSLSESRVEISMNDTGRYRIVASAYGATDRGAYSVSVTDLGAAQATVASTANRGGGQVYGVFVGISDYPGEGNDLAYTADDAHRVANAMVAGGGMANGNFRILTDADATGANVTQAIQEIGSQAGPDDMFVFFYSGHGSRIEIPGAYQPTDPDGLDETLVLYDGNVRDDEFARILDGISPGTTLLLLDACFSGGFSKDVISVPGRMGLFSSEEDVTSAVAAKFRAGGYLAQFVADAVGERLADADRDGSLTALEFSQYIHERYRADVKSASPDDFVRVGGPRLGFQHLVVDRGSIAASQTLFR